MASLIQRTDLDSFYLQRCLKAVVICEGAFDRLRAFLNLIIIQTLCFTDCYAFETASAQFRGQFTRLNRVKVL